ncbi:MAG: putative hydrogenase (Fe-only hydrogenase) (ferredoxin bidirectional hydrogenase), subunit [Firmicutes bacterium]|nr:putative hydrogenase (Fe-only hydrogenase) (ferredoxin bidirectional hydrogenase), subunit [Bacillota bacterium]
MQISVREIINGMEGKQALLQILLAVQDASPENYVSEDAVNDIAYMLNVSRSRVYSTASFYSVISLKPRGRHIVQVCINAPCENAGKQEILAVLEDQLGVKLGETTADRQFTLEGVSCLGACYVSPAIKIDDRLYGDLTPELVVSILREYQEEATALDCNAS